MLDEQRHISAQAIMKELIAKSMAPIGSQHWEIELTTGFKIAIGICENYATIHPNEEWMNTGVILSREYWNSTDASKEHFLTEWGIQKKDKDGKWYVFVQHKNMTKFVTKIKEREDDFNQMVQSKEEK